MPLAVPGRHRRTLVKPCIVTDHVNDAVALLGISQERVQEIGSSFTLQGTAKRIESKATVGDLEYRLVVITDRTSGSQLARLAP